MGKIYQNGRNIPKWEKIYQNGHRYTKIATQYTKMAVCKITKVYIAHERTLAPKLVYIFMYFTRANKTIRWFGKVKASSKELGI
jgi:hypothetical protein